LKTKRECDAFTHNSLDENISVEINNMVVKLAGSEMHYAIADKACNDGSQSFFVAIVVYGFDMKLTNNISKN